MSGFRIPGKPFFADVSQRLGRLLRSFLPGPSRASGPANACSSSFLESLEDRCLLSAAPGLNGTTLILTGDANAANVISVKLNSNKTSVTAAVNAASAVCQLSQISEIEIFDGNANNTVTIDPAITAAELIYGGNGKDSISTGGGNATVYGGDGTDTIVGHGGNNYFYGGDGNDSIVGGTGQCTLYGGNGNDTIIGSSGHDIIGGGPGTNVTTGPAGDIIVNNTNSNTVVASVFALAPLKAVISFTTDSTIYAGMAVQVNGVDSGLGVGDPNTARWQWNFGDTTSGSQYNSNLEGFNAAHIYNNSGTYTITFTLTNQSGQTATTTATVHVLANTSLRTIYVSPTGNDANNGLSTSSPVKTVARANALLANDTRLLFQTGATYDLQAPINIDAYQDVEISSYGVGAQPKLYFDGPATGYWQIINFQIGSRDIAINNICFDSDGATAGDDPTALRINGNNIAVSNCTFYTILDDMDLSGNPVGVMVQNNSSPSPADLAAYFVWASGSNTVILGNYVANSTGETPVRVDGETNLLVEYNNLTNINKGVVTVQFGSYAYVAHNTLNGPCGVGPLATTQPGSMANFNANFQYAVFDSNTFYNDTFHFAPGSWHVTLSNNIFHDNDISAIVVEPYDPLYGRIVNDAKIIGNTMIDNGQWGNFLKVQGAANGITVVDNLMVAPSLIISAYAAAPIYVTDSNLDSFTYIGNNVWPAASNGGYANGGYNYVYPYWSNPAGFLTAAAWNALPQVGTDLFSNITLGSTLAPLIDSVAADDGVAVPGLFDDYYGKARAASGTFAVGAVLE